MKVSILMVTYNHEKFIAQAIDSVLMQQVNFDYEIVIGEDCSTDKTREIVVEYQKKYPDKICLQLPEKNLGTGRNFVQTFDACQGEYIAVLDGDDYWISPDKLQRQVDFLDRHPTYSMCFHDLNTLSEDDGRLRLWYFHKGNPKEVYKLEDLLQRCFIRTSGTMFRKRFVEKLPDWFNTLVNLDWCLFILLAHHGDIGYLNEVMGVYRIHQGGVWSGERSRLKKMMNVLIAAQKIDTVLSPENQEIFQNKIGNLEYYVIEELAGQKDIKIFLEETQNFLSMYRFKKKHVKPWLKLVLVKIVPRYFYDKYLYKRTGWKKP